MDVANYTSTTPEPFKFVLESDGKEVICNEAPIGWNDGVMGLTRRLETAGITQSYLVDSLVFVGNAANFITQKFNENEANAEMTLEVYELRPLQMSYVPFQNKYKVVFSSYKTVKVGEFNIGVQVDLLSSGFVAKYDDRKTVKLDLTKRESLSEMPLSEFSGFPDKSLVTIPAMMEYFNARLTSSILLSNGELDPENSFYVFVPGYNSIPVSKITSDFSETNRVPYVFGLNDTSTIDQFFEDSQFERTLKIDYTINVNVTNPKTVGGNPFFLYMSRINSSNETQETRLLLEFGSNKAQRTISSKGSGFGRGLGAQTFEMQEGDGLKMYMFVETPNAFQGWTCYFMSSEIDIQEEIVNTPKKQFEGLPVYEALMRASQKVFDDNEPFYSDKFNRIDLGADSEDNTTFAHIMSGVNVRGLPLSDNSGGINISLEELLQGVSAVWCTGESIEFISDRYRLRVEDYTYFFNNTVIFDISDRVNELDISTEYMPELGYVEILAGYQSYVYRSVNGRSEYNTEATKITQLHTPNKLDLKCNLRADTTGFINCLMKPIETTSSEDIEEDNNVFILKTQKDGDNWKAEKEENIQIVDNSSLFADSSLNLFLTPARNLIRNSIKYTSALQKLRSSKIKHQTSNKYQNLKTEGEGYEITENEDITVNNLSTPLFRPIKHTFECFLTNAEFRELSDRGVDGVMNYFKLIKFTDTKYGWILDLEKQLNSDKGTFTLIEKI